MAESIKQEAEQESNLLTSIATMLPRYYREELEAEAQTATG